MTREERQRAREWADRCKWAGFDARYMAAALDLLDRLERILGPEFVTDVCAACDHRCAVCDSDPLAARDTCRVEAARKAMEG